MFIPIRRRVARFKIVIGHNATECVVVIPPLQIAVGSFKFHPTDVTQNFHVTRHPSILYFSAALNSRQCLPIRLEYTYIHTQYIHRTVKQLLIISIGRRFVCAFVLFFTFCLRKNRRQTKSRSTGRQLRGSQVGI